ncbi:c2H2-type domain-containing protein [Trichonephila clavata]|uniref:C2H2-type domain-containing protein n=1 Tax=Trichonephila clavata TaxID=2740835 RepID=A0A8X6I0U1_TRICU|nr:c2H2-type domain-containing protein [Trichonephila clavata]
MVKKMQSDMKNPVLLYKPVDGEMDHYSKIDKRDFLLGIMNDTQEKLLELYGKNCIMIDSTHGTNQYNFQLTTLMVHDENHEGLCPLQHFFNHE